MVKFPNPTVEGDGNVINAGVVGALSHLASKGPFATLTRSANPLVLLNPTLLPSK